MTKKILLTTAFAYCALLIVGHESSCKELSDEVRYSTVDELLSAMTIEEKCDQLRCMWQDKYKYLFDSSGNLSISDIVRSNYKSNVGQIGRPGDFGDGRTPEELANITNELQEIYLSRSRLGIPILFHDECLHGHVSKHSTSFPQPIALASSFDTDLVHRINRAIAKEARSCGIHVALSPVLDVSRDPRWGRVEETFGEDPYLVSQLGLAAVNGLQGDRGTGKDWVFSTLKHFAAHSQPEGGNNCAPLSISERHLREIFLYPFSIAVKQGNAGSVMASYNEIDGVPNHINTWLLHDVLRQEWNFRGTIVSDYYGISELHERNGTVGHYVSDSTINSANLALQAGINVELPEVDCFRHLEELVRNGVLTEENLDNLVRPVLQQKFELGLFKEPFVDPALAVEIVGSDQHQDLALEAAQKSIVLLKNDEGILPIDTGLYKKVLVVGPNANRVLLGGYSGTPKDPVNLLEGIKREFGDKIQVEHAQGCQITVGGGWNVDSVVIAERKLEEASIKAAVKAANKADIIILAVGGNEQTSREAWSVDHLGDRTDLQLVGQQDDLINALYTTGKPIIAVMNNGRPLAANNLYTKANAVLECWYLGQYSGDAIADVLSGATNPSGKLPITIPRSVGHLPAYYNYRPLARRGYLLDSTQPLFPFGYGLSYSNFSIDKVKLDDEIIGADEGTKIRCEVKNTSDVAGAETIQLYVRDVTSSTTRPVIELKGFAKVYLEPGEVRSIEIDIDKEVLAFWNKDMQYVVEPGEFRLYLSDSSNVSNYVELLVQDK